MNLPMRLAMFVSGGGTTMAEILRACRTGGALDGLVKPVLVVASRNEIGAIGRALNGGMAENDVIVRRPRDYRTPDAFGLALIAELERREVTFVGQYGWLAKTPANVIAAFPDRMVNQHPGPLDPGYADFGGKGMYGMRVHAARLLFCQATGGDCWTEATAHRVTEEYDQGALIRTRSLFFEASATPEQIQRELLPLEHATQIEALRDFALGSSFTMERLKRLVLPDQLGALEEAKQEAFRLYPHG